MKLKRFFFNEFEDWRIFYNKLSQNSSNDSYIVWINIQNLWLLHVMIHIV